MLLSSGGVASKPRQPCRPGGSCSLTATGVGSFTRPLLTADARQVAGIIFQHSNRQSFWEGQGERPCHRLQRQQPVSDWRALQYNSGCWQTPVWGHHTGFCRLQTSSSWEETEDYGEGPPRQRVRSASGVPTLSHPLGDSLSGFSPLPPVPRKPPHL